VTDQEWDRLAADAEGGSVSRGNMFGSPGLRTGKKFFAIRWRSQLVVKLPATRIEQIVSSGLGVPFEPMSGRPMNGWVVLDPAADRVALVAEANAFVESQLSG